MAGLKLFIKKFVPEIIWISLIRVYNFTNLRAARDWCKIKKAPKKYEKALQIVRKKEKVKVAFFLTHESVWKYDLLYNLMLIHPRFEPVLYVCPVVNYGFDNMLFEMNKTYNSFKKKGYEVTKTYDEETGNYLDIKNTFSPDLIFYTNPYEGLQDYRYYIKNFPNTLSCYVPYAIMTVDFEFTNNLNFHNLVWRIFSETPFHKETAFLKQTNKGKNNVVTGYPGFDQLLTHKRLNDNVWKNNNATLKKIIWAPHHAMNEFNKVANFSEYYDFFLELAEHYKDRLQIAFKPHHLLRVKLEEDPNWGKEKTDDYYKKWQSLENGQCEDGEYIDLFLTSDALIHDCGSFMSEYLVTGKPSLFMVRDESIMKYWSLFGEKSIAVHYQSRNKTEVINFIENVVLNENDWMKEERNTFVQKNLVPEKNRTASENILEYLEREFFQ